MGAEEKRGRIRVTVSWQHPPHLVPGGVLVRGHTDLAHPLRGESIYPRVFRRKVDALDTLTRSRGNARQLIAARHDAARRSKKPVRTNADKPRAHA